MWLTCTSADSFYSSPQNGLFSPLYILQWNEIIWKWATPRVFRFVNINIPYPAGNQSSQIKLVGFKKQIFLVKIYKGRMKVQFSNQKYFSLLYSPAKILYEAFIYHLPNIQFWAFGTGFLHLLFQPLRQTYKFWPTYPMAFTEYQNTDIIL